MPKINIANVIDKNSAILHSDGLKVYEELNNTFKKYGKMELVFDGLSHCTTSFLNASIGKFLISIPDTSSIKEKLLFTGTNETLNIKIDQVIDLALNPKKREINDNIIRDSFCA